MSLTSSSSFKISLFVHYFSFGAAGGTELPRTSASLPGLSDPMVILKRRVVLFLKEMKNDWKPIVVCMLTYSIQLAIT